jgi:uncharacterized protein with HEPN domain
MLEKDIANIEECLHAINSIQKYTEGVTQLDDLLNDSKTYDAVLMNFIVLGEAANRISAALKTDTPQNKLERNKRLQKFCCPRLFWH